MNTEYEFKIDLKSKFKIQSKQYFDCILNHIICDGENEGSFLP